VIARLHGHLEAGVSKLNLWRTDVRRSPFNSKSLQDKSSYSARVLVHRALGCGDCAASCHQGPGAHGIPRPQRSFAVGYLRPLV